MTLLDRNAPGPSAFARRAADARDVRAGVAHERHIVGRQLPGQRDEEPRVVGVGDPAGKRVRQR